MTPIDETGHWQKRWTACLGTNGKNEALKTSQSSSACIVHHCQTYNACALLCRIACVVLVPLFFSAGAALSLAQGKDSAPSIRVQDHEGGFRTIGTAESRFRGRSLFDLLMRKLTADGTWVHEIPYPFDKLRQALARTIGAAPDDPPFAEVLIPIGRSLQRNAAAPNFFRSPRIVLAAAMPPAIGAKAHYHIQDRLFIGYQAEAKSFEVISYNEVAGRFEFQIVENYGPGRQPKVLYANRSLCMSCHQTGAPIFPEAPWQETNASKAILELLERQADNFAGRSLRRGTAALDDAFAISKSVERAGMLPYATNFWRDGCGSGVALERGVNCRSALLLSAVQYALSNRRQFDWKSTEFTEWVFKTLTRTWPNLYPEGLPVMSSLIPDINPLATNDKAGVEFDPLTRRAPAERWRITEPSDLRRGVHGVASFLSNQDARILDAQLAELWRRSGQTNQSFEMPCAVSVRTLFGDQRRFIFRCGAETARGPRIDGEWFLLDDLSIKGRIQTLYGPEGDWFDALEISGRLDSGLSDEVVRADLVLKYPEGLKVRQTSGAVFSGLNLEWSRAWAEGFGPSEELPYYPVNGRAVLLVSDDFSLLRMAIRELAADTIAGRSDTLGNGQFKRSAILMELYEKLGVNKRYWPNLERREGPAIVFTTRSAMRRTSDDERGLLGQLRIRCAICHGMSATPPPNFLFGTIEQQLDRIKNCSQRILYRLSLWDQSAGSRSKQAMPPPQFLASNGITEDAWRVSPELHALKRLVSDLLSSTEGRDETVETKILARDYDSLASCLQ